MLIKKIYIMKGNSSAKSVLKIALLENGYAEVDLQTHFAYGDNYTFILKSGSFIHIETMQSRGLKRKLQPFSLDGLCAGIAKDGKIITWTADTPTVPYCLVELAGKYTLVKGQNLENEKKQLALTAQNEDNNSVDENVSLNDLSNEGSVALSNENGTVTVTDGKEVNSRVLVVDETQTVNGENVASENTFSRDITSDFNILSIENDDFSENNEANEEANSLANEIEMKYATYPHNEALEALFPDSKWIISSPEDLSLGLLYNSEKITHICYAKRGEKDESFDQNASFYDGWWIVFTEND